MGASQAAGVSAFGSIGMAVGAAAGVGIASKFAESLTNFMPQPAGMIAKAVLVCGSGLAGSYITSTVY